MTEEDIAGVGSQRQKKNEGNISAVQNNKDE